MNHTPNYQLTQWEKDDRIMMEDFNGDNAKIDAVLKANADAVSALQTGKANAAETAAAITAVEQSVKFVRLAAPQVTTAVDESIVFDLSALNMADYQAMMVIASVEASGIGITTGKAELACGSSTIGTICSCIGGRTSSISWVFPALRGIAAGYLCADQSRNDTYRGTGSAVLNESADWAGMTSLTVRFTGNAGASAALYGIRA